MPQLDVIILCRWGSGRLNYFGHLPGHLAGDCILWDTSFRTLKATGISLEKKKKLNIGLLRAVFVRMSIVKTCINTHEAFLNHP